MDARGKERIDEVGEIKAIPRFVILGLADASFVADVDAYACVRRRTALDELDWLMDRSIVAGLMVVITQGRSAAGSLTSVSSRKWLLSLGKVEAKSEIGVNRVFQGLTIKEKWQREGLR